MAAASAAVAAVQGVGAAGQDEDFEKIHWRMAPWCWIQRDPDDQGPGKEVLLLPAS